MMPRITQAQADAAAAAAARFWPEFSRRWPWTRAPALAPIYQLAGEQTVSLLRAFPALQWSNQARWYRRVVRDTPAIIALTPEALRAELSALASNVAAQPLDIRAVHTLVYLPDTDETAAAPSVAKTLLASSAQDTPLYIAQLAHEILNCFCQTDWDGQTLRSGLRRTSGALVDGETQGAALNDLLLDAMLLQYLPAATAISIHDLIESAQGPYWRIVQTLAARLRGVPALAALFGSGADTLARFENSLGTALDTPAAAIRLDSLTAAHDWTGLRSLLGD